MAERKKKKKQGRRRRTSGGRRRPRDLLFESSASAERADRTISGAAAAERFFSASYQQPKTFSVFAGQPATQERVLLSRLFPSSSSYCYYIQHQNSISYIKVSLRKNFFKAMNRMLAFSVLQAEPPEVWGHGGQCPLKVSQIQ